jgi:hypothetical protein
MLVRFVCVVACRFVMVQTITWTKNPETQRISLRNISLISIRINSETQQDGLTRASRRQR